MMFIFGLFKKGLVHNNNNSNIIYASLFVDYNTLYNDVKIDELWHARIEIKDEVRVKGELRLKD